MTYYPIQLNSSRRAGTPMKLTVPVYGEFGLYIIPETEGNEVTLSAGSHVYEKSGKYYQFYSANHPCMKEFNIVESSNDGSRPIDYKLQITFKEGLPFEVSSIKYLPINNLVTVRTVSDEELKAKRKSICG